MKAQYATFYGRTQTTEWVGASLQEVLGIHLAKTLVNSSIKQMV